MEIWKDIFRPGRYRDQSGELHKFTDAHIHQAHANAVKMLENGGEAWTPPAIWEHDWDSVPVPISKMLSIYETDRERRAGTAKNCFGHLKAAEIRRENGKPVLWGLMEIPDPTDAEKWKTVRYCSPRIQFNAKDPFDRDYPGASIFHVAATTRPIQIDQQPVYLSAWKVGGRSLFLSRDDIMAKEDDDAAAATPPKKPDGEGDAPETGRAGQITRLKKNLADAGFPMPDSAVDLDTINIAIEAINLANASGGNDGGGFGDDDDLDNPPPGTTGSVSPAMLSGLNLSGLNADQQRVVQGGAAALTVATNNTRSNLLQRLERISAAAVENGLATPVEINQMKQRLTAVSLSFAADGTAIKNNAMANLEMLEKSVKRVVAATKQPGGKKPTKEPKVGSAGINLSVFGAPGGVSEEDLQKQIRAAADAAGDRVAPRRAIATTVTTTPAAN